MVRANGRRAERLLAWLRQLLPAAALLVVTPVAAAQPPLPAEDALILDGDDIDSPLALAAALARAQSRLGDR